MSRLKKAIQEIKKSHRKLKAKLAADELKLMVWIDSLDKPEQFHSEPMPEELYKAFQGFGIIRQVRIMRHGIKAYRRVRNGSLKRR